MKKGLWVIGIGLFALMPPGLTWGQSAQSKQELAESKQKVVMIGRVKHLDVSKLERGLPKQEFATWLKNIVGPDAELIWDLNDCGEQTGSAQDADRDIPTCVGVEATLTDSRKVSILVVIGTIRKGVVGKPPIAETTIVRADQFFTVRWLRDLVEILKKTT